MPRTDAAVVVLPLHGGVHTDDLAVQAFARHLASAAGSAGRPIIAGMRAVLEDKPDLLPDPPWAQPPPTGYRAVELLAAAAGCLDGDILAARLASRRDLAGTAWILEPADGFDDLLELVGGRARLVVVADSDDPATGPVVDALKLADRTELIGENALTALLSRVPAALVIDDAWTPRLAAARRAGHTTALIDRFRTGLGDPVLRAESIAGLLPGIAAWLDGPGTTDEGAR